MPLVSTPLGQVEKTPFPGRVIKVGESEKAIVKKVQQRLNDLGCGPIAVNGIFDEDRTKQAVKLFQARFPDVTGAPLVVDGKAGSLTWGAMFGASTVPANSVAPSPLLKDVIAFAVSQIGVMEKPIGSNRGPEIDAYLSAAGLNPEGKYAWCVAFTLLFKTTAGGCVACKHPHPRTAGVSANGELAAQKPHVVRVLRTKAVAAPALVKPGSLFVFVLGGGKGHSGFVVEVANGRLLTIEGNTNDNGSREGIGVFLRTSRKVASINKGFIDYSAF